MQTQWASATAQEPFAFSSEQTAKWQNYGHHETGEDKCELSDHSFTEGDKHANAKAILDGQKKESCNATTELQDMSQSLISAVGSSYT